MVRGHRLIDGRPDSDQPMPAMPLLPWLLKPSASAGAMPAVPVGTKIGML
jgi:hypothetical protein